MACTNFIVGKKASVDGSVFVTYNADSYGVFMPLYHYSAAKHAAGEMRKVCGIQVSSCVRSLRWLRPIM